MEGHWDAAGGSGLWPSLEGEGRVEAKDENNKGGPYLVGVFPGCQVNRFCVGLHVGSIASHERSEDELKNKTSSKDRAHVMEAVPKDAGEPVARLKGAEEHRGESDHEDNEGAPSIGRSVEQAEEHDHQDGCEVNGIEPLENIEEAILAIEDYRGCDDGEDGHAGAADSPGENQLVLGGIGIDDLLVDAEGEEGGAGVED